jgi:phage terminase large subunit GpA-like protein
LSLSWGDIAAEWVDCQKNQQNLRNFVNQWLAETWEIRKNQTTWEQLGSRLMCRDIERGIVPTGFTVLTAGVDKQVDHFVFVITAWDLESRGHVLDYGTCDTEEELLVVLQRGYVLPIQRPVPVLPIPVHFTLIDSGYRPKGIHDLVKTCKTLGIKAMPCRGSSTALGSLYKKSQLGKDSASPGSMLALVDTITSQDWIEQQLHKLSPVGPGGLTLFTDSLESQEDFLRQLLNEGAIESEDRTNHTRESWTVLDTSIPNDYRDALRYASTAAKMVSGKTEPRQRKSLAEMAKEARG